MEAFTNTDDNSVRWRTVARVLAVLAALFWLLLFFGMIDLLVGSLVPISEPGEYGPPAQVLEGSWGLLYTVLVAAPLLAWAVQPRCLVVLVQVVVAGVAVLTLGLVGQASGQVVAGCFVVLSAVLPGVLMIPARGLRREGDDSAGRPPRDRVAGSVLAVLGVAAAVAATAHAATTLDEVRSGAKDDITWGLGHLPMQAAFGFALAGALLVAVVAAWVPAPGWKPATLPPSVSAVWFGLVCVAHPDQSGSVGVAGGWACVVWGIAVAAAAYRPAGLLRPSR